MLSVTTAIFSSSKSYLVLSFAQNKTAKYIFVATMRLLIFPLTFNAAYMSENSMNYLSCSRFDWEWLSLEQIF